MSGFEFLGELRSVEAWRKIPVVVATAKDLTEEDRELLSSAVEAILKKGAYTRDQLLEQVRDLVSDCTLSASWLCRSRRPAPQGECDPLVVISKEVVHPGLL